jgi:hypothetical protein
VCVRAQVFAKDDAKFGNDVARVRRDQIAGCSLTLFFVQDEVNKSRGFFDLKLNRG